MMWNGCAGKNAARQQENPATRRSPCVTLINMPITTVSIFIPASPQRAKYLFAGTHRSMGPGTPHPVTQQEGNSTPGTKKAAAIVRRPRGLDEDQKS
jgi:hypothetical protein